MLNDCTVEPALCSHTCGTRKVAFQDKWLPIGGSFVYEMPLWEMDKWPPIEGWLPMAVHSRSTVYAIFYSDREMQRGDEM